MGDRESKRGREGGREESRREGGNEGGSDVGETQTDKKILKFETKVSLIITN